MGAFDLETTNHRVRLELLELHDVQDRTLWQVRARCEAVSFERVVHATRTAFECLEQRYPPLSHYELIGGRPYIMLDDFVILGPIPETGSARDVGAE